MDRYAFVSAMVLFWGVLAFAPVQQASGAVTQRDYEQYLEAARGSDPFSERFELDKKTFDQVQELFDVYLR
jgi:hypothetical protein